MPGIENFEPERTETRSGSVAWPSDLPIRVSSFARASAISSSIDGVSEPLFSSNTAQALVEIVKPGGTGRPALVISASPAPLPPSASFMSRGLRLFRRRKSRRTWALSYLLGRSGVLARGRCQLGKVGDLVHEV